MVTIGLSVVVMWVILAPTGSVRRDRQVPEGIAHQTHRVGTTPGRGRLAWVSPPSVPGSGPPDTGDRPGRTIDEGAVPWEARWTMPRAGPRKPWATSRATRT